MESRLKSNDEFLFEYDNSWKKKKEQNDPDIFSGEEETAPKTSKASQQLITDILNSLDILTVLRDEWDIVLKQRPNGLHQGSCPFPDHIDSTPSFYIYPSNSFYCWGCQRGGTLLQFIQHMEGMNFRDAFKRLAFMAGFDNLSVEDKSKYDLRTIEDMINDALKDFEDVQLPDGMGLIELMLAISDVMRKYEAITDYNEDEIAWVDSLYQKLDRMEESCDFPGLTDFWNTLDQELKTRLEKFKNK